ncbi:MAG: siroheme synthase CysG [Hoeflea sp.]|uniref:siroheme synthase CysG n=1 Tax=Hoeflea sp. TaxID=1940281 RepID=UPI0032EEFB7F
MADSAQLTTFPAFMRVDAKKVAIFGNGAEAAAKARLVANTSARIVVYSDAPESELVDSLERLGLKPVFADLSAERVSGLMDGATLVFAATGDDALDRDIVARARALRIPANAVDQPEFCDFLTPALVNRAPVAIAIGTEGAGPVLAQMIRARVDQMLSPSLGRLARLASDYRIAVDKLLPRGVIRRRFWRRFFEADVATHVESGEISLARRAATRMLRNPEQVRGHVWLVGAGPGAEDLITLRAQRAMMEADAIVYDALVPESIVALGRRDAERFAVGKRKGCHSKSQNDINELLVRLANEGKRIVRLKSGDPLVFGRAGEEMAALRDAGVSFEIVPGITSAFAAAADFELPLTLRGVASSLVFTTGHDLTGASLPDWARLAISGATLCVYMGRTVAASVASRLIEAGLAADMTVAIVENASRGDRRMFHGTLADLPALETRNELTGPVMVVIGDAVAGADFSNSTPIAAGRRDSERAPRTQAA